VSSEIYLNALTFALPKHADLFDSADERVLHTAGDRPDTATLPALADPAIDHEDDGLTRRRADIEIKHDRVRRFLDEHGYDAVVLSRADSVAWFTSGGDLRQGLCSESASVALYINRNCRAVVTDNVQSARVFEEELAGLGFQLKERAWYEDCGRLVAELGHGKRLVTDRDYVGGMSDERDRLRGLRWPLTKLERQRLRELGRTLALSVEATCRNFQPGETEADVAGHLAHRLIREGVVPVDLRVASDDRLARYRQPTFKAAPIRKRAIIAAVGRRMGVCASVARIVSFGKADSEFRAAHSLAAMVDATCIFFSRPGDTISGVFRRARRIYEKFQHPDEWTLDYQGFLIGYAPREVVLHPDSSFALSPDVALFWCPSVGSARSGDTVVIDSRGFEVITEAQNWPKIEVMVKGYPIPRPGILER
jgi:Xaa-Pro dipeptidase